MKILLANKPDQYIEHFGRDVYARHLGLLVTPRVAASGVPLAVEVGATWAVDNDCFNGFNRERFITMLLSVRRYPNCAFVTAPDVVADAKTTLARFSGWRKVIAYLGLPVALVAQDGLEALDVPWGDFGTLFIGGTTDWKLSRSAGDLIREAQARGKWVHMGRVNGDSRLRMAYQMNINSVDGSGYARFSRDRFRRRWAFCKTIRSLSGDTGF